MTENDARADDVYQPQDADQPGELQPDLENTLDEPGLDDRLDTADSPPERPYAVAGPATTGRELRDGTTLDQRLATEVPEPDPRGAADGNGIGDLPGGEGEPVDDQAGTRRAGRLAPADDPGPGPHPHLSVRAHDVGIDGGAASAEEAAVHVIDEDDEGTG
ncbi:DUF5709 domain-containing protein [Streptomyces sp. NPDC101118]|uniref:DUF5709 domain-containing protein n=1 Tax=Streptomyces sp. NPDC101118 TaxID=3366109 RepID=UPI0037F49ED4